MAFETHESDSIDLSIGLRVAYRRAGERSGKRNASWLDTARVGRLTSITGLGFAVFRGIALSACLLGASLAGPLPVEEPAEPWREFAKAPGHDNEIPIQWLATEQGRFAHGIRLPDSIPRTTPFDFQTAWWKALWPKSPSVARQYWDHLCETEAGSFILQPVANVDGFMFMRPVHGASEQQNTDRWRLEAPGMEAKWGFRYEPEERAKGFVDPPGFTYRWVDFLSADRSDVLHLSGFVSRRSPMTVERRHSSEAEYGVTWRGIRRVRDREHLISGVEWIVLNRRSSDVLAVFRDFYRTGGTTNRREGIYWLNAPGCAFRARLFGRQDWYSDMPTWLPMVLQPETYPGVLEIVDERTRGAKK